MIKLIKQYRAWNVFEKKYFWGKTIYITGTGGYSINLLVNPFYHSQISFRIVNIIVMILLISLVIHIMHKSLSRQEREWKGIVLDPLTNKEVNINA